MIERLSVGALGTNCYVFPAARGASACVVVDPGAEATRIVEIIEARGWTPSLLALTHGHLDHTAGLGSLLAACRERGWAPRVAIHEADAAYLGVRGEATNRAVFSRIGGSVFFRALWAELPEPDLCFSDGDVLPGCSWLVPHTPGHTAGSVCFYEPELAALISGDTLFEAGVGRTDGPDSDEAALRESLAGKLLTLPPETTVFPGHGEVTTIGREGGGGFD